MSQSISANTTSYEEPSQVERVRESTTMPKGIPYIIGNEAAERFSFYGMRAILTVYMTKYLLDTTGASATMSQVEASQLYHTFVATNYFLPIFGALLSDIFLSKFKTIYYLSIFYCFGHLAIAIGDSNFGIHVLGMKNCLLIGLTFIAMGSGGIKPCVSAHVGDQFSAKNKHLLPRIFSWFYFSVNFGAFFSTLLTPWLLEAYGPHVAFGLPGLLMLIATIVFRMGHSVYTSIPAVGWQKYKVDFFGPAGRKAMSNLSVFFVFVAIFWAMFDQSGSTWVLQAEKMNLNVNLGFLNFTLLPSQLQAINPILVLLFIPLFNYGLYPLICKVFPLTPSRKIGIGMFVSASSFYLIALVQQQIEAGLQPSIMWHFWAYALITAAEVMISISCLEFAYTQSPNSMKSLIMSLYYLVAISLGNFFVAGVNSVVESVNLKWPALALITATETGNNFSPNYFMFFVWAVIFNGVLFAWYANRYKEELYVQQKA